MRRTEHRKLQDEGEETLTGSKFLFLFAPENLDVETRARVRDLLNRDLKVGRAWTLKEQFRHFLGACQRTDSSELLEKWYACGAFSAQANDRRGHIRSATCAYLRAQRFAAQRPVTGQILEDLLEDPEAPAAYGDKKEEIKKLAPRHEGPEAALEDRVALSLDSLLPDRAAPSGVAGSLRLGGGMPDLMLATFRMELMDLAKPTVFLLHILACLREISGADLKCWRLA